MSEERDSPYIPILRMGLEPSILFDREGSGSLGNSITQNVQSLPIIPTQKCGGFRCLGTVLAIATLATTVTWMVQNVEAAEIPYTSIKLR